METDKPTDPVYPPAGVTVIVFEAVLPSVIVNAGADTVNEPVALTVSTSDLLEAA